MNAKAATKQCPRCKETLSISAFGTNKHRLDGLAYACRECHAGYQRVHREKRRSQKPASEPPAVDAIKQAEQEAFRRGWKARELMIEWQSITGRTFELDELLNKLTGRA